MPNVTYTKPDGRQHVFETDMTIAITVLFFLFWQQSGWYRVDCALGVERACQLIAAEEDYRPAAERKWENR